MVCDIGVLLGLEKSLKAACGTYISKYELVTTLNGSVESDAPRLVLDSEMLRVANKMTESTGLYCGLTLIQTIAIWRKTRGVYTFEKDFLDLILSTKVPGKIDLEVLRRLPEHTTYVSVPSKVFRGNSLAGVFFTRMSVPGISYDMLEMIFLYESGSFSGYFLPLVGSDYQSCFDKMIPPLGAPDLRDLFNDLGAYLNLALYICSKNSAVAHTRVFHKRGLAKKSLVRPVKIYTLGIRKGGDILSNPVKYLNTSLKTPIGSCKSPHVRRAHWHGYWRGSRGSEARHFVLNWVPPTLIGFVKGGLPLATVRRVG